MKMKKRWLWVRSGRSRDRTSPPSGSGEPASPPCQSVTSPDRCEGGTSSAPALALDREDGDECRRNRPKQKRKKERRRTSPPSGSGEPASPPCQSVTSPDRCEGGTSSAPALALDREDGDECRRNRPKQKRKKERRRISLTIESSVPRSIMVLLPSNSPDLQGEVSSAPTPGKRVVFKTGKKKSFSSRRLGLLGSHSSSQSVAAQGRSLFDEEETSSGLKLEKPKLSSGQHGKIAQEQDDGYSGKARPSMDEEQGRAGEHAWALLDADGETISEKISHFSKMLNYKSPERYYCFEYEPEELIEVYERLALYRIRAYELTVDRKLAVLDDVNLKLHYPSSKLYDEDFFKYYEESLEWYFDLKLCKYPHFDDYQRITLQSHGKYHDWERYHSTLNTYEEDLAYVQFCEVLANETKWIEDYLGYNTHKRSRIQSVVHIQALEIAAGFPNVSPLLVSYGYMEHIRSMEFVHSHKGLDGLYFEIWKRVAKGQMSFREALLEVHSKDMFPSLSIHIKVELEHTEWGHRMQDFYDAHVADIHKMTSDDKALEFIAEAVTEMFPRDRYYVDYAKKKLEIAKDIGLITKESNEHTFTAPAGINEEQPARQPYQPAEQSQAYHLQNIAANMDVNGTLKHVLLF